ncbi:Ypt/Rab-specific GTPase-activating protein GYP6 [Phaffia rhodozyma]|uniref:Ypt/Rab-specific GTPase-activating protein GYP6 n=1 Tax=Phaffia rhodozyma TaxID=264483 RepID=A0A0F7SRF1_PHARH|nr:Ypt/Rab-specific GTPase-activating protein GYP6 [Phaffia rhodozyma]
MDASIDEEAIFTRPSSDVIQNAWQHLFKDPMLSGSKLKTQGLDGIPDLVHGGVVPNWVPIILSNVIGEFYLGLLPSHDPSTFLKPLSTSRVTYDTMRSQYLRAPDGRWAADVSVPAGVKTRDVGEAAGKSKGDLGINNPLSLESENPWQSWFRDVELRKEIKKDVERTYPDIPYFTLPRVQKILTTILFLYSTLHSNVGYRQGMHEICAAILLAVDLDSIERNGTNEVEHTLDRENVEHDTWSIYEAVMRSAVVWYQWKEEPVLKSGEKPQQPIVQLCNHLHGTALRVLDPQLWTKLEELGIEPQIYGIRWIRLMFTREFSLDDAMRMWDGIFSADPTLKMIEYICIAMLLRIRNEIIYADYSEALTILLRYPTSEPPLLIPLLLQQAILLRDSTPSPALGVSVVMENQAILGIPANPPRHSQEEDVAAVSRSRGRLGVGGARQSQTLPSKGMASRLAMARNFDLSGAMGAAQQAAAGIGIQDLAKGLMERGQALGIDKSLLGKVAEIRKNLPDFPASTYSRTHIVSPSLDDANQLPNRGFIPTPSSPDSESSLLASPYPPPLNVLEDEIAQLKHKMRCMGTLMDTFMSRIEKHLQESESSSEQLHQEELNSSTSINSALLGLRAITAILKDPSSPLDKFSDSWPDPLAPADLGVTADFSRSSQSEIPSVSTLNASDLNSDCDNPSTEIRPTSPSTSTTDVPALDSIPLPHLHLSRNELPSLSSPKIDGMPPGKTVQPSNNFITNKTVQNQAQTPRSPVPVMVRSTDLEDLNSKQHTSFSLGTATVPSSWIRAPSQFTVPWSRAGPSTKPSLTYSSDTPPQNSGVVPNSVYSYPPVTPGAQGPRDPLDGALDVEDGRKTTYVPRVGQKGYDPLGAL